MIPRQNIVQWQQVAPWTSPAQVEHDLVISRALVELFGARGLGDHLAFRGGTALHKLVFAKPLRYSEDIDLVQVSEGGIGVALDGVRRVSARPFADARAAGFRSQTAMENAEPPPEV